jgi:fatty acid CoA ligase FadD9
VIDRARNFFKLSNGVFIAPSELEAVYGGCSVVKNCFVFASDDNDCILAAVTPRDSLCSEKDVLTEMRAVAHARKLSGYLVPKRVVVDSESWTESNGFLSAAGKLCRPALQKRFHVRAAAEMSLPPVVSSVAAGVQALLFETLGGAVVFDEGTSVALLGATSLQLAALHNTVRDRFGVVLEIKTIADMTVAELSQAVFGSSVSIETVKKRRDWEKEVRDALQHIQPVKCKSNSNLELAFFLTGATGLVGSHLLAELLGSFVLNDVFCLVRAESEAHGLRRLTESLSQHGLLQKDFLGRVRIVVGSLDQPNLGFRSREEFETLATSRNFCVVHNGAIVNSSMPFLSLKSANVAGTCTMLEFAGGRSFHYVSTMGLLSSSGVFDETEQVPSSALDHLSG